MNKVIIILLICVPLLQLFMVPWMPGLDSDKAAGGIVAYKVTQGDNSIFEEKTVTYTGTLRLYAEIIVFLLAGANRIALEFSFAVYNSLTILFVFLFMRRLFGGTAGLWSALVISVSPWFVFRDIDNFFCTVLAAYLYCFSLGTLISYFSGGIVLGLGCYENQRFAVVVLAALISWFIYGRKDRAGIHAVLITGVGCAIGFSPRLIYSLRSSTQLYMEPFNNISRAVGDAFAFIPYLFGMIDGPLIFLRNAGCIICPATPFNSIIFIAASLLLVSLRRQRLYRILLIFTLCIYLLPFVVIKYTAIRYFLCALFGIALITALGLYELSLRYRKTAVTLLVLYCCINIFYICANFFIPFARMGGSCRLFKIGSLIEASHHLVRSDVLYECLDKDVPVIVCPEPFISCSLQFYDVKNGHFKTVSKKIWGDYDDFYYIDYAPSKLGRRIDQSKFPRYQITRECRGLKNFTVWRFQKRWSGRACLSNGSRRVSNAVRPDVRRIDEGMPCASSTSFPR